ncbi:MAG: hypothetical protein AAFU73_22965 [Planctomycetota bacterium]
MTPKSLLITAACLFVTVEYGFGAGLLGGFTVDLPNTFTAGTPARASEVNANFQALRDGVEALAADVEAELDGIPRSQNVVFVATSGAEFTSVAAAVASIADASATNRYLVQVGPGLFEESALVDVPEFVTVAGSGRGATVVRANRTSGSQDGASAVFLLGDECALTALTVENTGASGISNAVLVQNASSATRLFDVEARCEGSGGAGHSALRIADGNPVAESSAFHASGATVVSAAVSCVDSSGAFAQPTFRGCTIEARDAGSGIGLALSNSAPDLFHSKIVGWQTGIRADLAGISEVVGCRVETLGFNPVYTTSGSAAMLSAHTVFVGGSPSGQSTSFKYVHCVKANYDPVVNGFGSSVQ